ncbi:hypothetical protein, partial [Vibrio metschnikovii]|uniref:hypothetical protein n=1 Tax=Vibrio metschnikovii TaxID=28172 RepID=UPI001C2FE6FC
CFKFELCTKNSSCAICHKVTYLSLRCILTPLFRWPNLLYHYNGAKAWIGTRWVGSEPDQQVLFDYLDSVEAWNTQIGHGFEINIGEFGVFSQHSKPEDQRAWTAFIAREAEKRGFSWHYWEYSSGFGAYDPYSEKWRTALIEGLIPKSTGE